MTSRGVVTTWPVDGSAPSLSFYYSSTWFSYTLLTSNNGNYPYIYDSITPIVLNPTDDPSYNSIGCMHVPEFDEILDLGTHPVSDNDAIFNLNYNVIFNSGGSISYSINRRLIDDPYDANGNAVFRITNGSGPYTFVQGYVVLRKTDDNGGRQVYVYFGNNVTL
jgi:hypothetical protein